VCKRNFWGARASGVLVAAFCSNQLPSGENSSSVRIASSRWQNAIAGTLEACAPQKALAVGIKRD
jgi:hypothetical protein